MITKQQVGEYLRLKNWQTDLDLPMTIDATNAFIASLPDKPMKTTDEGEVWAETTTMAAVMFAARLYNRRNSPNGIEAMNEMGTTYVTRYDPDVARMLRLDDHRTPRVG